MGAKRALDTAVPEVSVHNKMPKLFFTIMCILRSFFCFIFARYFEDPKPVRSIILDEVGRLQIAISKSLRSPKQRKAVTVEFRGDVFKKLFGNKGKKHGRWRLLEEKHFPQSYFRDDWYRMLDLHGQGTRISFPMKVRHYISWSPKSYSTTSTGAVTEARRAFQEKITVYFIKVAA